MPQFPSVGNELSGDHQKPVSLAAKGQSRCAGCACWERRCREPSGPRPRKVSGLRRGFWLPSADSGNILLRQLPEARLHVQAQQRGWRHQPVLPVKGRRGFPGIWWPRIKLQVSAVGRGLSASEAVPYPSMLRPADRPNQVAAQAWPGDREGKRP